ncbi:MAG: DNA pilot protein [Arizlama microvirus]|nr:MAG: DNA pilot protein [Arizlama microvirus]
MDLLGLGGAALGGLGGAAIGAIGGYFGQKQANAANAEQAQRQMDFQERMSNTSYQRAIEDMKKAGLNPMLAYSQGGASTPGGALAPMGSALGTAVSSGKQGAETANSLQIAEQNAATTANIKAATAKTISETLDNNLHTALAMAELDTRAAQPGKIRMETRDIQERIPGTAARSYRDWWEAGYQGADNSDTPPLGSSAFAAETAEKQQRAAQASLDTLHKQYKLPESMRDAQYFRSEAANVHPYLRAFLDAIRAVTSARGAIR